MTFKLHAEEPVDIQAMRPHHSGLKIYRSTTGPSAWLHNGTITLEEPTPHHCLTGQYETVPAKQIESVTRSAFNSMPFIQEQLLKHGDVIKQTSDTTYNEAVDALQNLRVCDLAHVACFLPDACLLDTLKSALAPLLEDNEITVDVHICPEENFEMHLAYRTG